MEQQYAIRADTPTASGCWCIFVRINEQEGIKFFPTKKMRDQAADLQEHAFERNLAPYVGRRDITFPMMAEWKQPIYWNRVISGRPIEIFGYVTEIVDTKEISEEDFEILLERLAEEDISTDDMYTFHNVGTRSDGVIVRYDFDPIQYHGGDYYGFPSPDSSVYDSMGL